MTAERARKAVLCTTTAAWLLTLLAYAGTARWTFELTSRPPVTPGVRWNNLWLSGGRFGWSRYDPAQVSHSLPPPSRTRFGAYPPGDSWFWKPYSSRQPGGWYIGIPLWIPIVPQTMAGPVPLAFHARKIMRRQRLARNSSCPNCGYSLKNLPSNRCPECGSLGERPCEPCAPP